MKTLTEKLRELNACSEARIFSRGKSLKEAWKICNRGDWMLWLAFKMMDKPGWNNLQQITLAKVRCASLVKHLMKDERSLNALTVAEKFAMGEATRGELNAAYAAAAYATPREKILIQCADICRETLTVGKL